MKVKNLILLAVVTVIITSAFSSYRYQANLKTNKVVSDKDNTYEKEWKKADSLIGEGLTKSALGVVNAIYSKAKTEKNAAQFVKAVIHQLKLQQDIEEYSLEKAIERLQAETIAAPVPLKNILQSMLAESYWQYYQTNRYKFYERSAVSVITDTDIATWDLKTIFSHILKNYKASLENTGVLKDTPLNIYDEVLVVEKDARKFRPTLYDFLANRALDFYKNEEPNLLRPADKFELNEPGYFSAHTEFSKMRIQSTDTLSLSYYAIGLFQNLLQFHLADKHPAALVDIEIKRLLFLKEKSTVDHKDSLFINSLTTLARQFSSDTVAAEINYEIAAVYAEKGNLYNPQQSEENRWYKKSALELCQEVIKMYPGSYGAKNCAVLKAQLLEQSLDFVTDKITVPGQPFLALLTYKNVKTVYARIARLEKSIANDYSHEADSEENLVKAYLKLAPVKEWVIELKNEGDYQSHSTEIKLPELPLGNYVIVMGTEKTFSYKKNAIVFTEQWVSNISYVNRKMANGSIDFYVQHRETGLPLKGVEAQFYYQKYNYTLRKNDLIQSEKLISDEKGYFNVPPASEYRNFQIDFLYKVKNNAEPDRLVVNNGIYQYTGNKAGKNKTAKTFFFLDRGIYRPGQTVHFKGIMINSDDEKNEILPHTATKVALYDVNAQVVSELQLTTNQYGTFNGTFTIPGGMLNGQMSIRNKDGYADVLVEEYKRPKFEVLFNPVKTNYRLNETVKTNGTAKAFSGAIMNNAQVKYRVVRMTTFMPFTGGYWRSYLPPSPEVEITNGITVSNDSGTFFIDFKAIPDLSIAKSLDPTFSYAIYADVTDMNGETHSAETVVNVAYTAMTLRADMPGLVEKNDKSSFAITSANKNGEFIPAKGSVEIYKLKQPEKTYRNRMWTTPDVYSMSKEEFEKSFPNDVYKKENDRETWERELKVAAQSFNNTVAGPDSIKMADLKKWKEGAYVLEINSQDEYGQKVKTIHYFTLYSKNSATVPTNETDWFNLLTTTPLEPGSKAKFQVGTKEKNVQLIYSIEHKGEIVKQEVIALNNEVKSIEIPVEEKHRGNFSIHYVFVKNNRVYSRTQVITVPYTNKALDISFETFRDKLLPGQQEEWKIKIKDKKGDKVAAEMVATLYDASLDMFKPNTWDFNIYKNYYTERGWETSPGFGTVASRLYAIDWNDYPEGVYRTYEQLNWFGYSGFGYHHLLQTRGGVGKNVMYSADAMQAAAPVSETAASMQKQPVEHTEQGQGNEPKNQIKTPQKTEQPVPMRSNFSETAFFYPQLETDADGNVMIKFTMPDALTRWKMMGLATTKDLKSGTIEKELMTQKELMVIPQAPRFFRENDKIEFSAKISNLSANDLTGSVTLSLYDAVSMKALPASLIGSEPGDQPFTVKKAQSTAVSWSFNIPEGIGAITYKIIARAGNHSDGEEMAIPVLTNRMLVTEALPLPVRGSQTKTFRFEKLINQSKGSATLRNHRLTLEFTANPAWYAIQAMPYLMEYPAECSEQVFARYYANSIASYIANSSPKIKAVFNSWRTQSPDALLSNLEKNQELKSLLLQETPWVLDAKDETERKKRIALLFDFNKMSNELAQAFAKLQKMQSPNGGWPWFEGMRDDRYITQYIVTGIGHLKQLQAIALLPNAPAHNMVTTAISYLDDRIREDYEWLLKHDKANIGKNQLSHLQVQYLYARSFFKGSPLDDKNKAAFDYYLGQAKKYWLNNSRYMQGMIALALNRYDDGKTAKTIIKSLKENAILHEELGMYWKENGGGYYWHEAPVETQALLIEAFDEVTNDQKAVDDMKIWLLKSKQTQNWKTTKATADAVYALLLKGSDWLVTENNVEIKLNNTKIDPETTPGLQQEVGTGYFKTSWTGAAIKPEMGVVNITKKDAGVSWGALYWQYFEQLDKITFSNTPLALKKQLFLEKNTKAGPVIEPIAATTPLKIGDKIKVRITLRVDRDMEYVQMKDMRASAFEPTNVLSMYKYQDGLGYYESTRDAATHFFFDRLPKGTYIFEYPLMVTHNGNFSNGITSIQCMYAPEFMSNSEGIRVQVK